MIERKLPWLTEGAIRFLEGYLRPDMTALEFGAGASTRWMATKCQLTTVEHDAKWFDEVPAGLWWCGIVSDRPYNSVCDLFGDNSCDLILVDGRDRMLCVESSLRLLKPGGIMMLDNAERRHYHTYDNQPTAWARLAGDQEWGLVSDTQTKPDREGFMYDGWTTAWVRKPKE